MAELCDKVRERLNELEERIYKLEHTTTKKGETEVISDKLDKLLEQNIELFKDLRSLNSRYIDNSLMLASLVERQKNTIAYKNFVNTPLGKGFLITLVFTFLVLFWFVLSIFNEVASQFVTDNVLIVMFSNLIVSVSSILFNFKKNK